MEKQKIGSYKIDRKFGKTIVDQDGKQIAWIEDYVLAKEVCTFLNKQRVYSLYPEYVRIGSDCYTLLDNAYYSHRLELSIDFTINGDTMISASNNALYDGVVIKQCTKESWLLDVKGHVKKRN